MIGHNHIKKKQIFYRHLLYSQHVLLAASCTSENKIENHQINIKIILKKSQKCQEGSEKINQFSGKHGTMEVQCDKQRLYTGCPTENYHYRYGNFSCGL